MAELTVASRQWQLHRPPQLTRTVRRKDHLDRLAAIDLVDPARLARLERAQVVLPHRPEVGGVIRRFGKVDLMSVLVAIGHRRDHPQRRNPGLTRSEEHTSELQSRQYLVC